jgi:hypothetical protein
MPLTRKTPRRVIAEQRQAVLEIRPIDGLFVIDRRQEDAPMVQNRFWYVRDIKRIVDEDLNLVSSIDHRGREVEFRRNRKPRVSGWQEVDRSGRLDMDRLVLRRCTPEELVEPRRRRVIERLATRQADVIFVGFGEELIKSTFFGKLKVRVAVEVTAIIRLAFRSARMI